MRSRATQEFAYSPDGAVGGVDSVAPLPAVLTKGYTQVVENTTMRESAKRSATNAGTCAFIAQVSHSLPVEPNLRPAMNTTFGASVNFASASRDSRSASMHSIPCCSSRSRRPGSEKRATPMTRRPESARLAIRAKVGPIFPPTPSTTRSPGTRSSVSISAVEGRLITSSTSWTSLKRSGKCNSELRWQGLYCRQTDRGGMTRR